MHWWRSGGGRDRRSVVSDILVGAIGLIALYLFSGLRVLREYERGVYFLLGRLRPTKGPGLIFLPPVLARMQKVSLRVMAIDVPPQDVITRDNISIKVNAVLYMRVKTPDKAVVGVENYLYATSQLAQAAHIIGKEPAAIQLRYLQTVNEIASENNSTTIFPIPIDLLKGFMDRITDSSSRALPERTSGERLPVPGDKEKAKV